MKPLCITYQKTVIFERKWYITMKTRCITYQKTVLFERKWYITMKSRCITYQKTVIFILKGLYGDQTDHLLDYSENLSCPQTNTAVMTHCVRLPVNNLIVSLRSKRDTACWLRTRGGPIVLSNFEYLEKRSRGLDVTWQPVREDLTHNTQSVNG